MQLEPIDQGIVERVHCAVDGGVVRAESVPIRLDLGDVFHRHDGTGWI